MPRPKRGSRRSQRRNRPKPTKPWTPAEVHEAFSRFRKANPEPKGELEHLNPYTLLVAVVLSAQATDAGVNKATRALFAVADTPQKMLALGEEKVRDYIKTIGLYRNKAKNVIALSEKLIAEFGGEVPRTRAELKSLPGAGRKTANVVLNMAFGEHTMAVDTHVFRVGNRTGLAPGNTPLEVELGLEKRDSRRVHAARASLADPARPLHLPRAQAALRGVPDQRSLPLAGEDGVRLESPARHCEERSTSNPASFGHGLLRSASAMRPCQDAGSALLSHEESHHRHARSCARGSISSGRGPLSRLCMWTMKAMPNSGVARLTIGIDTNAAMISPAVNTIAALSLRIALASAGGRNRIAASSKYSRPKQPCGGDEERDEAGAGDEHERQRDQVDQDRQRARS